MQQISPKLIAISSSALVVVLIAGVALLPLEARAFGATFDGGELQGIVEVCTCSAGMVIRTKSYVDNMTHNYLYQAGLTQLYSNYNLVGSDGYFLTTLAPFAVCMIYHGLECDPIGQVPEGVFMLVGTSFKNGKSELISLLKSANLTSGVMAISKALQPI